MTNSAGVTIIPSITNGTAFDNLTAGTYYINGQCTDEKVITLTNPTPAQIPFVISLDCKNNKLLYKVVVTNTLLKPFKLKSSTGAIIPSFGNDGYTFIDLEPGTYTLVGDCSTDTPVVLPDFPAMPKIATTVTGNCPAKIYLNAEISDIGKIWQDWLVGKVVNLPTSFTTCGGNGQFILKMGSSTFNPNLSSCSNGKYKVEFYQIPAGDYELTFNTCAYTDLKLINIKPHSPPKAILSRAVVCSIGDKTDIKFVLSSTSFPLKIDLVTCGLNPTVISELDTAYKDTIFTHKNVGIGAYCYQIADGCGSNVSPPSAVAVLGSIRPNYRDSCGYISLYMDQLENTTYKWTSPPSTTVLSTTEKLVVKAEGFDRVFKVEVFLPNNTICTRTITIKANSGISPIPSIQDTTKLTTCEANGKVPLKVVIVNGVPAEFVSKIEWLDANKTVLGTGPNFDATKTGKYYVKITNDSVNIHCKFTFDSVNVIVPTKKLDAKPTQKNITCFRDKDGSIDINAEGGIPPYKYLWSNGKTTDKLSALDTGVYICTVTDAIKCVTIHTITITEPQLLVAKIKQKNTNNCDANWNILVTGGTTPYKVSFDGNPSVSTSDSTLLCVKVGTHTVNVEDDHGCKTSITQTFEKHDWPIKEQWVNICFGAKYHVTKSYGNGKEYDQTGNYYDTLSANVSCGRCDTVFLTHLTVLKPLVVTAQISSKYICGKDSKTKGWITSISGGSLDIAPPSTKGYIQTFQWSGMINGIGYGTSTKDITKDTIILNMIGNATKTDLVLTVFDNLGCKATTDLHEVILVPDIASAIYPDSKCFVVGCKGEMHASAGPFASEPFSYAWSDNKTTTSQIKDVCPNSLYKVTITDKFGCSTTISSKFDNPEPVKISAWLVDNTPLCSGSKQKRRIYMFASSPNLNDQTKLIFTFKSKKDSLKKYSLSFENSTKWHYIEVDKGGIYKISVADTLGCSAETTVEVKEFPALQTAIVQKDSLCKGSSVILTGKLNPTVTVKESNWYDGSWKKLSDGKTPISVSTSGTWFLVQSDNNGCIDTVKHKVNEFENPLAKMSGDKEICDGDKGTLKAEVTNNAANHKISYNWTLNGIPLKDSLATIVVTKTGTYKVTITDVITKCNLVLETEVKPVTNWIPVITKDKSLCTGASTTLNAGVGANVKIKWYKDGIYQSQWDDKESILVKEAGNYYVDVIKGSCRGKSEIFTLKVLPNPDLLLVSDLSICNAKTTTLSPKSTVSPLVYAWSSNEKTATIDVKVGSYSVTITDTNGCQATATTNVKEYPVVPVSFAAAKKICPKDTITLSLNEIFTTYLWSNGSIKSTLSVTTAGTYSVTVTNDKGCTATALITVENAIPVEPKLTATDICPNTKGTVTVINSNDFTKIIWNNSSTATSVSFDTIGIFTVNTIDKNGCPSEAKITTKMFLKPNVTPITPNLCQGLKGNISLKETFVSYLWSDKSTDSSLSVNTTGTYYVTVTDTNGCKASTFTAVTILPNPNPTVSGPITVCVGDKVTLETEKIFEKYQWSSNTSTSYTAIYPNIGTYSVTVTDKNGCQGVASKTVTTADGLTVKMDTIKVCSGKKATLNPGKYDTYLWSNGAKSQTIDVTKPGTYKVSVSIGNCKGVGEVTVEYFDLPTPKITGKDLPCFGKKTTLSINYPNVSWSTGELNKDSINVSAGIYFATVTDANGCVATTSITITERPKLVPEVINDEKCEGATATIGLKNSFPVMNWEKGEKTQYIQVVKAGSYSVTVVDANGCQGENFAKATINLLPEVKCSATKTPVCPNEKTMILANSPTATNYYWSNGLTIKNQDVGVGEYSVTVTDTKGCKASDTILIKELKPISAVLEVKGLKLCAKDSSTISLKFVGLDGKKANVTLSDGAGFFTVKNITKDTIFAMKPTTDKIFSIQKIDVEGYYCDISFDKNQKFEVKADAT